MALVVQDLSDDGLRALGVAIHSNPRSRLCAAACDAFQMRPPPPAPAAPESAAARGSTAAHGPPPLLTTIGGLVEPPSTVSLALASSSFGQGAATLLANVLRTSASLTDLTLDDFAVPINELKGSGASEDRSVHAAATNAPTGAPTASSVPAGRNVRLSCGGMPSHAGVQYGLLLGSLLSGLSRPMNAAHSAASAAADDGGDASTSATTADPLRPPPPPPPLLPPPPPILSATLRNDFGAGGGSDFALPLAQLAGEGGGMYVDLKGGVHSREHRAIVSGVVVGAFIRIHASLNRLDLRSLPLGVEGGRALALALSANTSLTALSLPEAQLGDDGAEQIAHALIGNPRCALQSLNLSDNGVGVRGASAIAEYLRVAGASLTALDGVGMSGTYFRQLRGVDPVQSLSLKGLGDTDSVVVGALLGANTTLKTLDLGTSSNAMGKGWGPVVAQALVVNTVLTSLSLGSNGLGDAGGVAVAESLHGKNFMLRALDVSSNRLQVPAARALAAVVASEVNLTSLNVGSNELGERGAIALFEAVARNHSLTSLNVSSNDLCPPPAEKKVGEPGSGGGETERPGAGAGAETDRSKAGGGGGGLRPGAKAAPSKSSIDALAVVLRTNTTLQSLDLSGNALHEKAIKLISQAVRRNASLTSLSGVGKSSLYFKALRGTARTLDLKGAGVGGEDLSILCDLLSANTVLTSLDLSTNALGDAGGVAIAGALARNDSMTSLDLSATGLGPPAGKALVEMLQKGQTGLTSLGLSSNPLETALRAVGFEAPTLKSLGLSAAQMRLGGFSADLLKEAGFRAQALKAAGFTAQELAEGGFPANQLKHDAGFTDAELAAVGFTPQELKSKLGLEGVAAVRQLDLSVSLPMTWDRSTRDDYHLRDAK